MRSFLAQSVVWARCLSADRPVRADVSVDPAIKSYEKVSEVDGNLNSIGSDTLNNVMTYWAEAFGKLYPNVKIQVEGKGSATAPPALVAGTAQLGPMSRKMKPEEEDAFEKQHGFRPTRISVALDCLAVYVHKDNPIKGLTLAQVDCIFSKTHKSGLQDIATWGEAGLEAPWDTMPISLYGRNSASGTYAYFKEHALFKGDYKDTVKEQPGSAAVVNGVAADRAGIGYSGIGYRTSEVRVVPLAKDGKAPLTEATFANALKGSLSVGPHTVHLRGQETRRAAAQAGGRVSQVRAFPRRPGNCRQGRLWSTAREDPR